MGCSIDEIDELDDSDTETLATDQATKAQQRIKEVEDWRVRLEEAAREITK
jgi:hypothetical protein